MQQHLYQGHLPLQLMKNHTPPLYLLHSVLVKTHRPRLKECKGKTINNTITTGGTNPPTILNTEIIYRRWRENKKIFAGYTPTYREAYWEIDKKSVQEIGKNLLYWQTWPRINHYDIVSGRGSLQEHQCCLRIFENSIVKVPAFMMQIVFNTEKQDP